MNCNVPTDICFSFEGFHRRGGATDDHADGWGIAFFEGPGCRVFIDSKSAVESPVAKLVREYPIRSTNVIAHIRRATRGIVALENTHPFVRELWGRYWIFAHNGTLEHFAPSLNGVYRPVGTTDSERAFCYMRGWMRSKPYATSSRVVLCSSAASSTPVAPAPMIPTLSCSSRKGSRCSLARMHDRRADACP